MAFWHGAQSVIKCFYQLLIPELTPVSLLESTLGFESVTPLVDNDHHEIYCLWLLGGKNHSKRTTLITLRKVKEKKPTLVSKLQY
jgi:hypothetical protein